MLGHMSELGGFNYQPMCQTTMLTYLIFVDNLMAFFMIEATSINKVMNALRNFSSVKNLKVNL